MSKEKNAGVETEPATETKVEDKQETMFVPAEEVMKYLSDLSNVLELIVKGIRDSKVALIKKQEKEKGETANDSDKD